MYVRNAMSKAVVEVGPHHTLRQAARLMSDRSVGSAVVCDPDGEGTGIITERDILKALAAGLDPDAARVAGHITWEVVYAGPNWTIDEAATEMIRGGFRHLVVLDGDDVLGVISVRDIVRCLIRQASSVPA